jgi:DNA gyrase subunit A
MSEFAKEVLAVNIEQEVKKSYLDYAMSVIVGRALPCARDGLKPVHRRVLYAMHELGNEWNKAYKKSARVAGDVIGKYHPHGETAVYDAIVRMVQPFSLRYPLVDGQGNFGSVDGDSPAAMRYTEVRMSKLTHELLADLDKDTVDFVPNYDGTEKCPEVMPTRVPNLLINGSSGIAVGMATNIPPHNLSEIIAGCLAVIEQPDISVEELMTLIPGPDFPTSGIINGREGIIEAYKTGRGRIYVRAKTHIETNEKSGKQSLIITELPYQVNKARLVERIAELVKEKLIEGITELRDESDKDGMRVVIEVRRGDAPEVLENNLFSQTQMQTVFGINMVALVDGRPRLLSLKEILEVFIRHRQEIVTRRTVYELAKARDRAHILEGLGVALVNIEEMIAIIKTSNNPTEAREALMAKAFEPGLVAAMLERTGSELCRPQDLLPVYGLINSNYRLSPMQAQAILDLRLHRLTSLEQEKILNEYKSLLDTIQELLVILAEPARLIEVIREELLVIKQQFGDERRTEIVASRAEIRREDLISDDPLVVTFSHQGYVKAQSLDDYQAQKRGGRGKSVTNVKEEDFIDNLIITKAHDTILLFSNLGKVYWLKVYDLPQAGRGARGRPIVNLLNLTDKERISAILPVREFAAGHFLFLATAQGTVKKIPLELFARHRSQGIIAISLENDDSLVGADITTGNDHVMLFTNHGKVIRFEETRVRSMGRTAKGVRGVSLKENQKVISLLIPRAAGAILTATQNGYGKRTDIEEYRLTGRGGQGVISIQVTERNGEVVGALFAEEGHEMMLITDKGTAVRIALGDISLVGRNTQGVRLIRLQEAEKLVAIQRIVDINDPEMPGESIIDDEAGAKPE